MTLGILRPADLEARLRARVVGLAGASLVAAVALLLVRLVPDLRGKPLFEDEAVAGLISARPLRELLGTVMWDRGGAPLHFVLAHAVFVVDPSPTALRFLSAVFAVATIAVCFELGRSVGDLLGGAVASLVAASSTVLAIYGTFGRMYSLFAAASGLATLLFVRAIRRPTRGRVVAAACAGWLLLAVHPYAVLLVGAELFLAAILWRGRGWSRAVPVAVAALAAIPFVVADVRLGQRFSIGIDGGTPLAGGGDAWQQLERALRSFAGGGGSGFWLFVVLALCGLLVLARRARALVVLALLLLLVPPILFSLLTTRTTVVVSPRHLVFLLPVWSALIGAAVAEALRRVPLPLTAAGIAGVAVLAMLAPAGGLADPREFPDSVLGGGPVGAPTGGRVALGPARAWLERSVEPGAVAFPYSTVYLAALPAMRHATTLPRAQRTVIVRTLDRVRLPVPAVYLAVPLARVPLDLDLVRARLGHRYRVHQFGFWLIVEGRGPFLNRRTVLRVLWRELIEVHRARTGPAPPELQSFFSVSLKEIYAAMKQPDPHKATTGRAANALATTAAPHAADHQ